MDKDSSIPPGFLAEWSKLRQVRLLSGWIQAAESPDALNEIKNAIGDADEIGFLPKLPHLWLLGTSHLGIRKSKTNPM